MNRRLLILAVSVLALHTLLMAAAMAQSRPAVRVAFVHDRTAAPWTTAFRDSLRAEIARVLDVDFAVQIPAALTRAGDGTAASVRAALDELMSMPDVDLVIASGPLGSLEASRLPSRAHPVIGGWILDTELQQVPMENGTSGVDNFTYVTTGNMVSADLAAFREVVDYKSLAIVGTAAFVEALPDPDGIQDWLDTEHITMVVGGGAVEDVLEQLLPDTDAVYLLPMVDMTMTEISELLEGLALRRLPTLSFRGEPEVQAGALLGVAPSDWQRRVYRRIALTASQILVGDDPAQIPVTMPREGRLYLNMRTANRVGVSPRFEVIIEAVLIDQLLQPGAETVDLKAVMDAAQANNRDIAATEAAVLAGEEQVNIAKSDLLPQIDLGLGGYLIDKDNAAFFPTTSERTLTGSATLTQLIWSDRAWAGYSIEKYLQEARVGELNRVRLDVGLEAATAYLDVLRAQTRLQLQRQNLTFSRANLERAEVRVAVGDANRSELYRWQSKIAGEQTAVMDAAVLQRLTSFELNRVLNRSLEYPLELVDNTIDDQYQSVVDPRVDRYIHDPMSLDILREFLVRKGLTGSPELQQFDAAILASERAHTAANRSFWSPDIGLTGAVDHVISRGGEGSVIDDPLVPDDTSWNVGVFLALPLLEGGARFAETRRTTQETYRLMRDREAAAARIEQNVRSATFEVAASRLAIDLAGKAVEASSRNLELVADNYTLGRMSLVDLLDAQTNALNAELDAVDAVNGYLLDLMRVERAVGQFMFFVAAEDREIWIEELQQFELERP